MGIGIWFWVIFVGALLFGFAPTEGPNARYWRWGGSLVWLALFFLLGLDAFGGPIKGR